MAQDAPTTTRRWSRRRVAVVTGAVAVTAIALLTFWSPWEDGSDVTDETSLFRGIVLDCHLDPAPGTTVVARNAEGVVLAEGVSDAIGTFAIRVSGSEKVVELCAKVGEIVLCSPAAPFVTLRTRWAVLLVHLDVPTGSFYGVRAVSENGGSIVYGEYQHADPLRGVDDPSNEGLLSRFLFCDLDPGPYRIEVRTTKKILAKRVLIDQRTSELHLWWSQAQPLDTPGSTLSLRLLAEHTGEPLANTDFGFQVSWPAGGTLRGTGRTDSNGRVEFTTARALLSGAVLEVDGVDGYQPWAMLLDQDHPHLEADVTLGWRSWPSVTVLSVAGEALPGIGIRFKLPELLEPRTAWTDDGGRAMLVGMPEEESRVVLQVAAYRPEKETAMSRVESAVRVRLSMKDCASVLLPKDALERVRVICPHGAQGTLWTRNARPESRWNSYDFRDGPSFVFAHSSETEQWEFLAYAHSERGRTYFGEHVGPRGSEHVVEMREATKAPLQVLGRNGLDVLDAFAVPEALIDTAIVPRLFPGPPGYRGVGTRSAIWHLSATDGDSSYVLRRTGHPLIILSTAGATSLSPEEQLSDAAVVDPLAVWVGTVSSASGLDVSETKITAWIGEAVVHTVPDRNGAFIVYRNGETEARVELRLHDQERTVNFEQARREYTVSFD